MIGIIYILISLMVGAVFCDFFLPGLVEKCIFSRKDKISRLPGYFILFPAWYIVGTVLQTWLVYFVGYGFKGLRHPLTPANAIVLPTLFLLSLVYFIVKFLKGKRIGKDDVLNFFFGDGFGYFIFTVVIVVFSILIMYKTLYIKDGELHVGYSVWADFGAHLGMIRSFSYGNNFPTQYTYFGGEDIRYHFLFQFLVGNLEYIGLPLDHAFNIPSVLNFVSMYLLLFTLTVNLLGSRLTAWLGALFFTFRSSPSLFIYLGQKTSPAIKGIEGSGVSGWKLFNELSSYFNYSNYQEAWGFWCTRVFCNQRHFALGISAILLALIVFLPYIRDMGKKLSGLKNPVKQDAENADSRIVITSSESDAAFEIDATSETEATDEEVKSKQSLGDASSVMSEDELETTEKVSVFTYIKEMFFTQDGWWFVDLKGACGMGIFLGAMGFWHGSALIAALSMLFFMAAFSMGRLDYVITAGLSTGLTLLQSKFFIFGSAVAPEFFFGFIADNKTFWGVMLYIFLLTGITLLIALFAALKYRGVKRYMLLVFTIPFILSFFLKLTPDIGVNHKWVIISLMLISIYTADFVADFLREKDVVKWIVACIMIFCLTATGIAELNIQKKEDKNSMVFDEKHPVTMWIKENISSRDLVLTDSYPLTNIVLGGIISYYSYPYCAWSAGYDTKQREMMTAMIFEAESPAELDYYIRVAGIDYIILDISIRESQDYVLNEENIADTYEEVFTFGEDKWAVRVFDTKKPIYK